MNIQKIFEALELDTHNSALGIICAELEAQAYEVVINGNKVTSEGFYNGEYSQIEKELVPLNFSLFKNREQEFAVEFVDFHEIKIGKKVPPKN